MSSYFVRRDECSRHTLFPGVDAFTMAGDKLMLSWVELEPHAIVELHSHPHEQLGVLLEGELTFTIGDEERQLGPGDMWRIPGWGGAPGGGGRRTGARARRLSSRSRRLPLIVVGRAANWRSPGAYCKRSCPRP